MIFRYCLSCGERITDGRLSNSRSCCRECKDRGMVKKYKVNEAIRR